MADRVISLSADVEKYENLVRSQCQTRFGRFVAILANDTIFMDDCVRAASKLYGNSYDVILFMNNPEQKKPTWPHPVWYFNTRVFSEDRLNVGIYDAIYHSPRNEREPSAQD